MNKRAICGSRPQEGETPGGRGSRRAGFFEFDSVRQVILLPIQSPRLNKSTPSRPIAIPKTPGIHQAMDPPSDLCHAIEGFGVIV